MSTSGVSEWFSFGAIDPALRNFGMAAMRFNLASHEVLVDDLKLIGTEKDIDKKVRSNSSDLRCAKELYAASVDWFKKHGITMFAAEIPSGSQSARANMSAGICLGVLASLSEFYPLIQVQIGDVKKVVTGRRTASKEQMIRWATDEYPKAPWLRRKLKGELVPTGDNEHLADAVCVGIAATKTSEFRAAVAMMRRGTPVAGAWL